MTLLVRGKPLQVTSYNLGKRSVKRVNIDTANFVETVDANGWSIEYNAAGKKIWKKSGGVVGLSIPAGIAWINGTATSLPVGLTQLDLHGGPYILTDAMIVDGSSRHVIPHTIFDPSSGTILSYGLINTFSGGTWSGSLRYHYRIEQL